MGFYKQKNRHLMREIVLFNATTLKTVYNHEKNTLPTQSEIDEERELYQLYADKDWIKIKQKTRALRKNFSNFLFFFEFWIEKFETG